jgi:flagellar basal body-associated protein FliL
VRTIKKNNINVNRETIIIIAIAAAGAIGIAAVMKILQKLGVFKSKEQKEQEKNTEDAIKYFTSTPPNQHARGMGNNSGSDLE